jgi:hypothetical protein
MSLAAGAFEDVGAYDPDLRTNVNSPGWLTVFSDRITPIIAATMFALAIEVGAAAYNAADAGEIQITNSQNPTDDICIVPVSNQVIRQIRQLGLDRWSEACEQAREAARRSGLESPVKTSRTP